MQLAQGHSPGRGIAKAMPGEEAKAGEEDGQSEQDNNDNNGGTTEDESEPNGPTYHDLEEGGCCKGCCLPRAPKQTPPPQGRNGTT